ncbi:MAG: hypothetical protein HQ530_01255 [Parcubacteria group bacterium]|nr:hypothetical protein [Parcubacteria group bacterium]
MGVREQLGQQPDDEMRLQDLVIENSGEKEMFDFDVESEVTESDWQAMREKLNEYRESENWEYYFRLASSMKILRPEEVKESELEWMSGKVEEMLDTFYKERYRSDANVQTPEIFQALKAINAICPDKLDNININDRYDKVVDELNNMKSRFDNFMDIEFIAPELIDTPDIEDEALVEAVNEQLGNWRSDVNWRWHWSSFATTAGGFKYKYPHLASRMDISDSDWFTLRSELERTRDEEHWIIFTELAASLEILSADEVEMGIGNIKFTKRKSDFHQSTPPRPERKELN